MRHLKLEVIVSVPDGTAVPCDFSWHVDIANLCRNKLKVDTLYLRDLVIRDIGHRPLKQSTPPSDPALWYQPPEGVKKSRIPFL